MAAILGRSSSIVPPDATGGGSASLPEKRLRRPTQADKITPLPAPTLDHPAVADKPIIRRGGLTFYVVRLARHGAGMASIHAASSRT